MSGSKKNKCLSRVSIIQSEEEKSQSNWMFYSTQNWRSFCRGRKHSYILRFTYLSKLENKPANVTVTLYYLSDTGTWVSASYHLHTNSSWGPWNLDWAGNPPTWWISKQKPTESSLWIKFGSVELSSLVAFRVVDCKLKWKSLYLST